MCTPLFGLPIHHLDDHMVVVDKPAQVLTHRSQPRPQLSLQDMLEREFYAIPGGRFTAVHRLDRETSGLVVLARTREAARHLSGQFERRAVTKRYRAIVTGIPTPNRGVFDGPIGAARGSRVRKRRAVNGDGAQPARTRFRVIGRRGQLTQDEGAGVLGEVFAMLALMPVSGRLHQLRVHLAAAGHAVVGDKVYGPDERWHLRHRAAGWTDAMARALALPRHALHAEALSLVHPESGEKLRFRAPLPADMAAFWNAL